jgi:predicted amidohydrolase
MSRKIRVATVAQRGSGGPTVADNRAAMARLAENALAERPDILCLPETFLEQGVRFASLAEVAETLPGPTTDAFATLARAQRCYIICPLTVAQGGEYFNDAVLLDRQGQIVGVYSKVHPVVEGAAFTSLEKGITPGTAAPVFDTDFGRIGMQICFDINWEAPWAALKAQGAEIVFWSSAYDGGRHLSAHAWNYHYYVVSAVKSRYARIIDVMGEVLAVTGAHDPVVTRTIDLDVGLFHCDFNATQLPLLRAKYGPDITLRLWHEEGLFTLESNRPELSVAQLVDEFALDPLSDYLARNDALQAAWREHRPVPDLTPRYAGRTQWG